METTALKPATEGLIDGWFPPDFFRLDFAQLSEELKRKEHRREGGSASRPKAGQKALLSGRDFILPELVTHADNGDLSVRIGAPTDRAQLEQVFRLTERGEQGMPTFGDLSYAEQQLERRRYADYLKRSPKQETQRAARQGELAAWLAGGLEAEGNFRSWWECKQQRQKTAFLRKANRLANCSVSGRRLDCRDHPDEHQFFGAFKCQCRYCRLCGADIFSELFHKYMGLWPTVKQLLPANGFRSKIVIAKLDFTAVNLGRMPSPRDIRSFNEDIRECLRRALRELGIKANQYGFLGCDEFGGFNPKAKSHNTNLHAHGVYVGPYLPQELLVKLWTEIRAEKDGAKIVWIEKQKIDKPPDDFLDCERRRFIRALGHALKYTGKHLVRSDGARLGDLEMAFHGVRRVHSMGLFYHADLRCQLKCSHCDVRCELVNGHEGEHHCKSHGHENRCPLCNGYLMFPRESGYALVSDLKKEGRRELAEVRRQVARDRVLHGPRGPDEKNEGRKTA